MPLYSYIAAQMTMTRICTGVFEELRVLYARGSDLQRDSRMTYLYCNTVIAMRNVNVIVIYLLHPATYDRVYRGLVMQNFGRDKKQRAKVAFIARNAIL